MLYFSISRKKTDQPSMGMEVQMKELVFVGERPLGSLMFAVKQVCVIRQTFIVADVFIQGVSIITWT